MARFISKCSNQVLTIKPSRNQIVEGIVENISGEHIRFENGVYETEDKKELEFLRKHRFFGNRIFEDKVTKKQEAAE